MMLQRQNRVNAANSTELQRYIEVREWYRSVSYTIENMRNGNNQWHQKQLQAERETFSQELWNLSDFPEVKSYEKTHGTWTSS